MNNHFTHTIYRTPETIDKLMAWAYFDGSEQNNGCGDGTILYLTENHFFNLKVGLGMRTNKFSELISLRLFLIFA